MAVVDVVVTGDKELMAKLDAFKDQLDDFGPVLHTIGDEMVSYFSGQAFSSQGGVFGTPWAKLAPSTQQYKIKHFPAYAAVPLMATGKMRKSFKSQVTGQELTVKNTADYFVYHQSSAARKKIPRRKMIAIDSDVKNIIGQLIQKDIKAKISAAGL